MQRPTWALPCPQTSPGKSIQSVCAGSGAASTAVLRGPPDLQPVHKLSQMARVQRAVGLLRALGGSSALQNSPGQLAAAQQVEASSRRAYSAVEPVAPAVTNVDIEDELFLRQRSQITLGNRHPHPAEGAWIAPGAVVVGDVDLYDKVRAASGGPGTAAPVAGGQGGRCTSGRPACHRQCAWLRAGGSPTEGAAAVTPRGWVD